MRLHRFFVDAPLHEGEMTVDSPALCHQMANVLRLRVGERIILLDGERHEAEGELREISAQRAYLTVQSVRAVSAEPTTFVTLYCAVLKRENFEWVVQKTTEVGVGAIVPLLTDRTVKTGLKMERLQKIAREAAEQSGRGIIPEIHFPISFHDAVKACPPAERRLLFHCSPEAIPSARAIPTKHSGSVVCFVGPEGGWSNAEVRLAAEHDFSITSLGALTLRAETAAVVAVYAVLLPPS